MLGLPQSTEVKRSLPKAQLYRQFDWKPAWCDAFDAEVSRLDFVNWIAPKTVPAIAAGVEIKEIFVVEVMLKQPTISNDNLLRLVKSIPQRIVWALTFEDKVQLAAWHSHLFTSERIDAAEASLPLNGFDLDATWQNIICTLGEFVVEADKSLTEQIKVNEEQARLQAQIDRLDRQMRAERQPRRKNELFKQIQKLKGVLYGKN
ncbi:MAG: DUF4391 domain-containing protein [Candidatus Limisoma sp.]|nr:DUF4391 domain-containing protein [Bacteroidales bacterium]MDY5894592.1 DUF4391 domain-containing protein [Candidatus Limisoma sp.]